MKLRERYEALRESYWSASSFYFIFGLVIGMFVGFFISILSSHVVGR